MAPSWAVLFSILLSLAVVIHAASPSDSLIASSWRKAGISQPPTGSRIQAILSFLNEQYPYLFQGKFAVWEMVQITALCTALPGLWFAQRKLRQGISSDDELKSNDGISPLVPNSSDNSTSKDANSSDPGLLKKHSDFKTYSIGGYTYPSLRIFHHRHPQADKLPIDPAPLPLLVFIHGLGGSVAQFHPLLTSLVNLASCLAIDLPGCGRSSFGPTDWNAYTSQAMADLVAQIIDGYREKDSRQGVVLIGHSMGCSLAALIASSNAIHRSALSEHIMGLVAICPKAAPPSESQVAQFRKLLWVPGPIFDMWRRWDRRGGPDSTSVHRFVGADADMETKKLQERFNEQSRTLTWRRMASGTLPRYENGIAVGGLPGKEIWAGLGVPVFLVAGASDNITKPEEIEKIAEFMGKSHPVQIELDEKSETVVESASPIDVSASSIRPSDSDENESFGSSNDTVDGAITGEQDNALGSSTSHEDPSTPQETLTNVPPQFNKPRLVLKTTILPAPASHSLLYMPSTVRTLAGLISDFLCTQVSPRLSLGWQLQFLSTAGKWDVKNLAKWQAVAPVSEPISGVFRAMKTLREVDESHCPEVFVRSWAGEIKDIIDISHESPVYDPRGLEKGGIHYHKFPTVSKIPPTDAEINSFIEVVDRLREEQKARAEKEHWSSAYYVGVHCHYGFNRTGYFIVCYLVERCGYSVQGAIDEFARRRPKGIKHAHFLDRLFVRYCVGLKRAPTL